MDRLSIWAIRFPDFVLYRNDMPSSIIQQFIKSKKEYLAHEEHDKGNIYIDEGTIALQEWCEYKVRSLNDSFIERDFYSIGTYGSENYGTLLFKNCVGFSKFREVIFKIESRKISESAFSELVERINSYIVNLSYDYNLSSFSSVFRNKKKKSDLQYHVFLMLHHALSTKDKVANIFRNFKLIEANPSRKMKSSITTEHISLVDEVSTESILDALSNGASLKKYNGTKNKLAQKLSNGYGMFIPERITCEEIVDSYDNPENRFVKFFLSWCYDTLTLFHSMFLKEESFFNYELLIENEKHIKQLSIIIRNSFLKNVGELTSIPMNSTVLTRRDGYRQLFNLYLGIKSLPENDSLDLRELIENKSLDVLYENYCYFSICDILASIYNQRLNKKQFRVQATQYSKVLEKKTNHNYFEFEQTETYPRIKVHYNKNYCDESYSKPYDPDISIEIYNARDELVAIYIFDAKFKIGFSEIINLPNDSDYTRKGYNYDDISKMHTYRDAIIFAQGAYILYPGTEKHIYFEDATNDNKLLIGVGAFSFRPDVTSDSETIKKCLVDLLGSYKK